MGARLPARVRWGKAARARAGRRARGAPRENGSERGGGGGKRRRRGRGVWQCGEVGGAGEEREIATRRSQERGRGEREKRLWREGNEAFYLFLCLYHYFFLLLLEYSVSPDVNLVFFMNQI